MNYESPALPALEASPSAPVRQDLVRLGAGLALSAVFGLALGMRVGGAQLLRHAVGVPLGLLVVAGVAAPALFVRLSLLDAPLHASRMLAAVARATNAAGLVLAGLAPAMALLVVTIESPAAAGWTSGLGLALAGGIGLFTLLAEVRQSVAGVALWQQSRIFGTLAVFAVLSCALAARAWHAWLPLLGGAQ